MANILHHSLEIKNSKWNFSLNFALDNQKKQCNLIQLLFAIAMPVEYADALNN